MKESCAQQTSVGYGYPEAKHINQGFGQGIGSLEPKRSCAAEEVQNQIQQQAKILEDLTRQLCDRLAIISSPEQDSNEGAGVPVNPMPEYFRTLRDTADYLQRSNNRLGDLLRRLEV